MSDKNTNTINKNPQGLLEACREVGLEADTKKMKYMVRFHHQNAGQTNNFMTAKKTI